MASYAAPHNNNNKKNSSLLPSLLAICICGFVAILSGVSEARVTDPSVVSYTPIVLMHGSYIAPPPKKKHASNHHVMDAPLMPTPSRHHRWQWLNGTPQGAAGAPAARSVRCGLSDRRRLLELLVYLHEKHGLNLLLLAISFKINANLFASTENSSVVVGDGGKGGGALFASDGRSSSCWWIQLRWLLSGKHNNLHLWIERKAMGSIHTYTHVANNNMHH